MCVAALATETASAQPAAPITTQIGIVRDSTTNRDRYVLQDESGRQITPANGYNETPTGQVVLRTDTPDSLLRYVGQLYPSSALPSFVESDPVQGPFNDGWLHDSPGQPYVRGGFDEGFYGNEPETVTYSGDANYRPASKTTMIPIMPANGRLIPTGSLTLTPGTPHSTVTVRLPSDATGIVRGGCAARSLVDQFRSDYEAWFDAGQIGDAPQLPAGIRSAFGEGGAALEQGVGTFQCDTTLPGSHLALALYLPEGVVASDPETGGNVSPYGGLYLALNADPETGGSTEGIDPATSLAPGQQNIRVTVDGLTPNTEYTIYRNSTPVRLGTVTTNAQGQGTFPDALPNDITDGEHHYSLEDGDGRQVASAPFTVSFFAPTRDDASFTATADTDPGTEEPTTGSLENIFGS